MAAKNGQNDLLEGQGEHGQPAHHVAHGQEALRGQVAVGHLAADEDGRHRGDGLGGEDPADLGPGEAQEPREVEGQERQPGAPDDVLQEHHQAQAPPGVLGHGYLRGGVAAWAHILCAWRCS